ncbi:fatty acid synthase subunit alpha reductase, partial [Metarhizium hybridum]
MQITCVIANKLKGELEGISPDKTISNLVGGRSTLSNEIVGELDAEFPGILPDRPEEIPLKELAETLQAGSSGRLGKSTSSLVAKAISSKFPGDYSQSNVGRYLGDRWGLGAMRQEAALLMLVAKQPVSRLPTADAAEKLLGEVAAGYFAQQSLALPVATGGGGDAAHSGDPKALQMVNEKASTLLKTISEAIQAHLAGDNPLSLAHTLNDTNYEAKTLSPAEELDMWLAEHGDDHAHGMMPKFDAEKARVYDSDWNWTIQDIVRFIILCKDAKASDAQTEMAELSMSISNRACHRSISWLQYLKRQAEDEAGIGSKWLASILALLSEQCNQAKNKDPVFTDIMSSIAPVTKIDPSGKITVSEVPRKEFGRKGLYPADALVKGMRPNTEFTVATFRNSQTSHSPTLSLVYQHDLQIGRECGFTFAGKSVLLTGAGKNSIGFHILRCLLAGGARVTVTCSSFSTKAAQMYQSEYAKFGARNSVLRVVPFNQGSNQDVHNLIRWMYGDDETWDLDCIIPFAAVSENGRDLENIDSKAELCHRLMLTNLLRMLGAVARAKRERGIETRPVTVVLPLSPNHGLMGSDGLYSESKRSLEALLGRWTSES